LLARRRPGSAWRDRRGVASVPCARAGRRLTRARQRKSEDLERTAWAGSDRRVTAIGMTAGEFALPARRRWASTPRARLAASTARLPVAHATARWPARTRG